MKLIFLAFVLIGVELYHHMVYMTTRKFNVPDEIKDSFFMVCSDAIEKMFELDYNFSCDLRDHINDVMIEFEINNMWREVFFLTIMGVGTNGLRVREDLSDGTRYNKNRNFGNLDNDSDGPNFRMRGAGIWLLGRNDYKKFSEDIGDPSILTNPGQVTSDPKIGIRASAWKWKQLGMNKIADGAYQPYYQAVVNATVYIQKRLDDSYGGYWKETDNSIFKTRSLHDRLRMRYKRRQTFDPSGFGTLYGAYYKVFMSVFSTCQNPSSDWMRRATTEAGEPHCYVGGTGNCGYDCEDPSESEECESY